MYCILGYTVGEVIHVLNMRKRLTVVDTRGQGMAVYSFGMPYFFTIHRHIMSSNCQNRCAKRRNVVRIVGDNDRNSYDGGRNMVAVATTVQRGGTVGALIGPFTRARHWRTTVRACPALDAAVGLARTLSRRPVHSMNRTCPRGERPRPVPCGASGSAQGLRWTRHRCSSRCAVC